MVGFVGGATGIRRVLGRPVVVAVAAAVAAVAAVAVAAAAAAAVAAVVGQEMLPVNVRWAVQMQR